MNGSLDQLPDGLPVPVDDGACDHLIGHRLPSLALASTAGGEVELATLPGRTVIYCYPRTGQPGVALPDGWDAIPGARGCTPQSCAFRDHYLDLQALGSDVFGLSTQSTPYQKEMAARLHLPFQILSDENLAFAKALNLPMFEAGGMQLIKRLTLVVTDGVIDAVHYPVFPSDSDPTWVLDFLRNNAGR